jgi:hypothetical protein
MLSIISVSAHALSKVLLRIEFYPGLASKSISVVPKSG